LNKEGSLAEAFQSLAISFRLYFFCICFIFSVYMFAYFLVYYTCVRWLMCCRALWKENTSEGKCKYSLSLKLVAKNIIAARDVRETFSLNPHTNLLVNQRHLINLFLSIVYSLYCILYCILFETSWVCTILSQSHYFLLLYQHNYFNYVHRRQSFF